MAENKINNRCEHEICVEQYFGIELKKIPVSIPVTDHTLVDFVCHSRKGYVLASEVATTPVKITMDNVRRIIYAYDREQISMSKMAELFNQITSGEIDSKQLNSTLEEIKAENKLPG